jgi:hypothetical protein
VPEELPDAIPDMVPEAWPDALPDPLPDEVPEVPDEAELSSDPQPTIGPRVSAVATRTSKKLAFADFRMSSAEHVACRDS